MKIKCVTHGEYYAYQNQMYLKSLEKNKEIKHKAVEIASRTPVSKPEVRLSIYDKVRCLFRKLLKNRFIVGKFYIVYNLYHSASKGPRMLTIYRLPLAKSGKSTYPNPYFIVYSFQQSLKTYSVKSVNPKFNNSDSVYPQSVRRGIDGLAKLNESFKTK